MNQAIHFSSNQPKKQLISLTPLIDVVFILLVFFMLTSQFQRWYLFDTATQTATASQTDSPPIHLTLHKHHYVIGQRQFNRPMDTVELQQRLGNGSTKTLIIEAAPQLELQEFIDALDHLHSNDLTNYQLYQPH